MDANEMITTIDQAADCIRAACPFETKIAVVLGSGLGGFAENLELLGELSYSAIPGFPISTVPGHSGKLLFGRSGGVPILAMSGRFHYYEGYSMETIAFPIRVMRRLGITHLLLTNAAGGINTSFSPGDLMVITDHIKFFDESPLRGPNLDDFGPRFCDMSNVYTRQNRVLLQEAAEECGVSLQQGVYFYMPGPSFETPAEIRALRLLGADAVGMSTVPEAIACAHCGIAVTGISCITNMAAGILDQPLSHEEVMAAGHAVADKFSRLVTTFLTKLYASVG